MKLSLAIAVGLFLLTGFSALPSSAAPPILPKILLLTSLNASESQFPKWQFWRRAYSKGFEARTEELFRAVLKKNGYDANHGYDLEIHHRANQSDLWQALHDPGVIALFWLSHSSSEREARPGVQTERIVDYEGVDVKSLFREVHPNLRFLGVIGCGSLSAIQNSLNLEEATPLPRSLRWLAFDQRISAKRGLKKALEASLPALSQQLATAPAQPPQPTPYRVRVERAGHQDRTIRYPSLRIEDWQGRVLGVFPEMPDTSRSQVIEIVLPISGLPPHPEELQIIANLGSRNVAPGQKIEIGALDLKGSWEGSCWSVFSDSDNTPIGVNSRVYEYRRNLAQSRGGEMLDSQVNQ